MEDMFSLGNVGLWKYVTNSSWAPTGEVGELFITKILGTIILKLKYKDVVYAVSKRANEKHFRIQTSEGERLFWKIINNNQIIKEFAVFADFFYAYYED